MAVRINIIATLVLFSTLLTGCCLFVFPRNRNNDPDVKRSGIVGRCYVLTEDMFVVKKARGGWYEFVFARTGPNYEPTVPTAQQIREQGAAPIPAGTRFLVAKVEDHEEGCFIIITTHVVLARVLDGDYRGSFVNVIPLGIYVGGNSPQHVTPCSRPAHNRK